MYSPWARQEVRTDRGEHLRIALGCDHTGVELKQKLLGLLSSLGHAHMDFGCYDIKAVDYPDVAEQVGRAVSRKEFEIGILICGTGIGMSIAANKISGIRAALCNDTFSANRAREHNDANILCLGAQSTSPSNALEIVNAYLDAKFEGGRHQRRVLKINMLDGPQNVEGKSFKHGAETQ